MVKVRKKINREGSVKAGGAAHGWIAGTGKFLLGLAALFLLFNFVFSLLPLQWPEDFYARGTLAALQALGFKGEVVAGEPVLVYLLGFSAPLGFTYLCTGLLELALVWSAVLTSFGIDLKRRAIGVAVGAIVLVLFNFVRIISSVLVIAWFGLDAGNFAHDIFFRTFLFVTVAGYYYAWFRWAAGKVQAL